MKKIFLTVLLILILALPAGATDFKDYVAGLTEDTTPATGNFLYELNSSSLSRKVSITNLLKVKIPDAAENKILIGSATPAWTVSSFTLAAPGAQYAVLSSDGTNWIRLATSANVTTMLGSANYAAIKALLDVDDLITLSGVAAGEVNLSTFTGSTIPDSQTIKAALQALETALELKAPSISPSFTTPTLGVATATRIGVGQAADGTNPISSPGFYVDPDGDVTGKSFSTAKESGVAGQICAYTSSTTDLFGICWEGPDDHMTANYLLKLPDADPSAGQVMAFSAPSLGRSTISWVLPLVNPMTAGLTLRAGNASAGEAPLYFQAATALLGTPVAGAMEVSADRDLLYYTIGTGPARKTLLFTDHAALITGVHGLVFTAGKTLTLTESLTLNALPIGGLAVATSANTLGSLAVGLTTQILVGGGAGMVPAWAADIPTAVTIGTAYIYRVGGTYVSVADGGTGLSSGTEGGIPWYTTTTAMASSALLAANGVMIGGGIDAAPSTVGPGAEGTLLMGNGAGAPSFLAAGTDGYILVAAGAADPVWTQPTGTGKPVKENTPTLITPVIGAATGTSLIATGIVDGLTNVTICTDGTESANPTGKMAHMIVNKHATPATALTVTLATPIAGMQLIVKNGHGAGGTNTGVITIVAGTNVVIYNPTTKLNCAATQNLVSAGAAGDYVAMVAMDSTHLETVGAQGTWTCTTP